MIREGEKKWNIQIINPKAHHYSWGHKELNRRPQISQLKNKPQAAGAQGEAK